MVNSRAGTYTPSPSPAHSIITGVSHSPRGSHRSTISTGVSPSTNSPTGSSSIAIAQVSLLLGTLKVEDPKGSEKLEQLKKLLDDNGMEVFHKYFSKLVSTNAHRIFPSSNRPLNNSSSYELLVKEMHKVRHELDQARKIAESIETASTSSDDLFHDFDLSTFMDHFKLDALEKTILALAFKLGSKPNLKTKADAILSTNYHPFCDTLGNKSAQITPQLEALILDRYIQHPFPNYGQQEKTELWKAIQAQYSDQEQVPTEILSFIFLMTLLDNSNPLIAALQSKGSAFTAEYGECMKQLVSFAALLNEEHFVAGAILYTVISRAPSFAPGVFVKALGSLVGRDFDWNLVVGQFDSPNLKITSDHFLSLYEALRPLAVDGQLDIQRLWGGAWSNTETQLSFVGAFGKLSPTQLDATTIPNFESAFDASDLADSEPEILQIADDVARRTLTSLAAMSAIFGVALATNESTQTLEAKRLFVDTVKPNMHVFLVCAFAIPRPWSQFATETVNSVFEQFLFEKSNSDYCDFVLESLWRKDKAWVAFSLMDLHSRNPMDLVEIYSHVLKHHWLDELLTMVNGFALDLAAYAHSKGNLNIEQWAQNKSANGEDLAKPLLTFLNIKAGHELAQQRNEEVAITSLMLPVRTVANLLAILESLMPKKDPSLELIQCQRACITAYPRLINYGGDYDDLIDANGAETNALPPEANDKMEEHYKRMYSQDVDVRSVVTDLNMYKHSRNPADQDVFACMIHGLFDEYALYHTYPLEALATTAVLFGGIIASKLISDLPLEIGLGMILQAVRDVNSETMYKFGLQALLQLSQRLEEWPGYCKNLLEIPGLQGTEVWSKAEEVLFEAEARNGQHNELLNGGGILNGNIDEMVDGELSIPKFAALNVEQPHAGISEEPSEVTVQKVNFVLNNITTDNLKSKFSELNEVVADENLQWFSQLIVEERAKGQPNYHELYLELLNNFNKRNLWTEILRQTYVVSFRMLNSEATMQAANERTLLKNLGAWLGLLTLARDKPIKHKHIAFKQLLLEAFDTQRLLIVIPFVCKVLIQGKLSTVFKPPNPWLMDIIYLLIEFYHHGELKLNLKFEIEVLCKELKLDHKTIEPSSEIMDRVPVADEATEPMALETMDRFDNLSLNGLGGGVGNGRFSPHEITSSIPDLGPLLNYPPVNDMVNQSRLHDILKQAITRAVHEIISPVVERSVTIAAISTAQMIHKDFAIEPDENRVRSAAINMVKKTAGSLALVTSKEPLRASMTNYIRALAADSLPLPEGTIIMCVNSNLDLACSQVEKKAEERAVPEIEEMIEVELEKRRHHQATRPGSAYQDPSLSRWALTIPAPYKLQPNLEGLNPSQLAIYEDFARHPRVPSLTGTTHVGSSSDATRSMANDILQDQYPPSVSNIPTPAETPAMPLRQSTYPQPTANVSPGFLTIPPAAPMDHRGTIMNQIKGHLERLEQVAAETPEQHYSQLPQQHELVNMIDSLYNFVIKCAQGNEGYDLVAVDEICDVLFSVNAGTLLIESLVSVLENTCRIKSRISSRIAFLLANRSSDAWMNVPLATTLVEARLVDWQCVDAATSKNILQHKSGSLEFLSSLIDVALINDQPIALYTNLAKSLEDAWNWIAEDPSMEAGQALKQTLVASDQAIRMPIIRSANENRDQMLYIFEEWCHLCDNPNATEKASTQFISQVYSKQIINDKEDLCKFIRLAIDYSIARHKNQEIAPIESLAKLIRMLVMHHESENEVQHDKAGFLKLVLSVIVLVLNYHHLNPGERFQQRLFVRLFAVLLEEFSDAQVDDSERANVLICFADAFYKLTPSFFPGFAFGWITLISHPAFLPNLMELPNEAGWEPFSKIMLCLITYTGDLLKQQSHEHMVKLVDNSTIKLLVLLQHDYPEFLSAYQGRIILEIPSHCTHLINLVLTASGKSSTAPDTTQNGQKVDRNGENRPLPDFSDDIEGPLRQSGLFEMLETALQTGDMESTVAYFGLEFQKKKSPGTGFGYVPINVDLKLINSVVAYVGKYTVDQSTQTKSEIYIPGDSSAKFLSMLVQELHPEPRYYMIGSIMNQIRAPSTITHYFCQAVLSIWGQDNHDSEQSEVREQIARVLMERLLPPFQPWGITVLALEFIKTDAYGFFRMPFVKNNPEIARRFIELTHKDNLS